MAAVPGRLRGAASQARGRRVVGSQAPDGLAAAARFPPCGPCGRRPVDRPEG